MDIIHFEKKVSKKYYVRNHHVVCFLRIITFIHVFMTEVGVRKDVWVRVCVWGGGAVRES